MSDKIMTIILTIISSSGIFTIIQLLLNRYFNKQDKKDELQKALVSLAERTRLSELSDSRTQLLILINHYHDNHYAILKEAENYFCNLKGDSWMIEILTNWAEEEDVDISYLKGIHEENLKERGHQ